MSGWRSARSLSIMDAAKTLDARKRRPFRRDDGASGPARCAFAWIAIAAARPQLALATVRARERARSAGRRRSRQSPLRRLDHRDEAWVQALGAESLRRFADLVTDDTVRVVFIEDKHEHGELGAIIVEVTDHIVGDMQMSADSARWFRTGRRDIAAHRDGVTVDAAGLSPFVTAASKLFPDLDARSADRYWLSLTRETQVPTAPVLGMPLVRNSLDMRSAIQAGRALQWLHLAATAEGIAAQPLNQPVECMDRDAMLGRVDSFGTSIAKLAKAPGF